jgi:DNA recombination protein RmuC
MPSSELIIILISIFALFGIQIFISNKNKNNKDEEKRFIEEELEKSIQKVFFDQSEKTREQHLSGLNEKLNPFSERLTRELESLKTQINDQNLKNEKDRASFNIQMENLLNATTGLQDDAMSLTYALKGDPKYQGDWGEKVLERALEDAGLEEGLQYRLQKTFKNNKGKNMRPDAVINLPGERHVIIDSKVSLTAYERYMRSEDEKDKKKQIKEHISSLEKHIRELSEKQYEKIEELNCAGMVHIFVPNEMALTLAIKESDWGVHDLARKKNMAFLTPTSLSNILRIIESMWMIDKQSKNAQKVAERAGLMLDKYSIFFEYFEDVGKKLNDAEKSYIEAKDRLTDGDGNLHGQMKKLQDLGMKGNRSISKPKNLGKD